MLVKFDEIPEDGLRIEIEDESWFPDRDLKRTGAVRSWIFLERRGCRVFVSGYIDVELQLSCDRCLEAFSFRPIPDFRMVAELVASSSTGQSIEEHLLGSNEMDVMFLEKPVIDVFELLDQQILLALPVKKLCNEECRGICSQCGSNINVQVCSCESKAKITPFTVLAQLKK
ncbi:MAG: DUF177 domain-containing protein [Proteobacteria bacterium]|nr:DUF177 domain-containing protein [Pseudomonadota bacterium]MBU1710119.1 DUF177 domain-containing protein [Pseudomonadota bacterium]